MSFNDKLYELVTKPENWEIAKKISDNMDSFVKRLIEEFWKEIGENIKKKFNLEDWEVSILDSTEKTIRHSQWVDSFFVSFGVDTGKGGKTFLGWWWKNYKYKEDLQLLSKLKKVDSQITKQEGEFPGFFYIDDDPLSLLEQILPLNRQLLVEKYSNMIIKFIENTNRKATDIKKILNSR